MKSEQTVTTAATEPVQTASADFFIPIAVAYVAVCATWWLSKKIAGEKRWPDEDPPETDRKWIDLLMILIAAVGVFGIGALYRADWLIPELPKPWSYLATAVNLSLPYMPIFLCLVIRKQSLDTVWISHRSIGWKLGVGFLAAVIGLFMFYLLRGELASIAKVAPASIKPRALSHAPAVFLEAVAVAFVFVRLRWIVGPWLAILIPSLLFALGHVPSGIESGRSVVELAAFFVFNTGLVAMILATVMASRDVIWIAIPHYFLDIAIEAFGA